MKNLSKLIFIIILLISFNTNAQHYKYLCYYSSLETQEGQLIDSEYKDYYIDLNIDSKTIIFKWEDFYGEYKIVDYYKSELDESVYFEVINKSDNQNQFAISFDHTTNKIIIFGDSKSYVTFKIRKLVKIK